MPRATKRAKLASKKEAETTAKAATKEKETKAEKEAKGKKKANGKEDTVMEDANEPEVWPGKMLELRLSHISN